MEEVVGGDMMVWSLVLGLSVNLLNKSFLSLRGRQKHKAWGVTPRGQRPLILSPQERAEV